MREAYSTPGGEVEFRATCDAFTLTSGGGAMVLPSIVFGAIANDPELLERAKVKAIKKATKAKINKQEVEVARLQRETLKK